MRCTRHSVRLAAVTPNFKSACCLPSPALKGASSSHCFQFPQLSQRSLLSPGWGSITQFSCLLNSQLTELRDAIPVAFHLLSLSAVECGRKTRLIVSKSSLSYLCNSSQQVCIYMHLKSSHSSVIGDCLEGQRFPRT